MQKQKRGQISTEYLLVISFVLFVVLSALGIAMTYSAQMKDTLKFNQIETFSQNVISAAETVYYSGEPSKTTVKAYLPEGIREIRIKDNYLIFNVSTKSGEAVTAYRGNVNMTGSIAPHSGLRVIYINATSRGAIIMG
mgnify:CR=1 FL=1